MVLGSFWSFLNFGLWNAQKQVIEAAAPLVKFGRS